TPLKMENTYCSDKDVDSNKLVGGCQNYFGIMIPTNIAYPDDNSWSQAPAGYIISSAEDMGKYLQMYLKSGNGIFNEQLLNDVMYSGVDASSDPSAVSDMYGGDALYCMGWINKKVDGETVVYHSGKVENYTSVMVLLPERNVGVVMLFNSMDFLIGQGMIEKIEEGVISILRGNTPEYLSDNEYVIQHILLNVIYFLILVLTIIPIILFIKNRYKNTGYKFTALSLILNIILHVVLPVTLIIIFPLMGMPLFVIKGFVPDLYIILIISAVMLFCGGIIKIIWLLNYQRIKKQHKT
ncbi:MAG: serine hydrolase, partial [Acutalibacteraceae bacterium]